MKKKIKQFEEKWCPDKGSGFISPLCHIDDIDLLLKAQKEENDKEWRRRADTLIADQMKEFANTELSKRRNAFDELYEVRKKINLLK